MRSETYIGVVLTRVRATRLLAGSGSGDCLRRALEEVAELERLDEVRVPDHDPVLDADLLVALEDLGYLLDTLIKRLLGTRIAFVLVICAVLKEGETNRKTAASACMAFCMFNLIWAVGRGPSAFLILSKNSIL